MFSSLNSNWSCLKVIDTFHYGCPHADGVTLCLHQLTEPETIVLSLGLSDHPELLTVATEAPDLACYDQLLARRA